MLIATIFRRYNVYTMRFTCYLQQLQKSSLLLLLTESDALLTVAGRDEAVNTTLSTFIIGERCGPLLILARQVTKLPKPLNETTIN